MGKPDDIPQDIWAAAEDAFDTVLCNDIQASGTAEQFRIDSITPVARALMAERERCAKIAETVISKSPREGRKALSESQAVAVSAGNIVAAAIRKPSLQEFLNPATSPNPGGPKAERADPSPQRALSADAINGGAA